MAKDLIGTQADRAALDARAEALRAEGVRRAAARQQAHDEAHAAQTAAWRAEQS